MDGPRNHFENYCHDAPYVPGRSVACAVDNINKPIQTQGQGFRTAVRNGLVPLKVLYGNERYSPGMTVWIESGATKLPWAGGEYQFSLPDGPKFVLIPEDFVRLVTK